MLPGARRLLLRPWAGISRRAVHSLRLLQVFSGVGVALLLLTQAGAATPSGTITKARYGEPTARYDHGILGDAMEWGALVLQVEHCAECGQGVQVTIRLPENRVFEDIAPRLISGNDGVSLVLVVETDLSLGARLALYDETGVVAATPFIGRPHRWLAPIGAADMDGDGRIEIAYIDRPHLAKTLRIWRLGPQGLTQVGALDGLSNHQIGWDFIPGGLRVCGAAVQMIVASGDWDDIVAVTFSKGVTSAKVIGRYAGPASLNAAQKCHGL